MTVAERKQKAIEILDKYGAECMGFDVSNVFDGNVGCAVSVYADLELGLKLRCCEEMEAVLNGENDLEDERMTYVMVHPTGYKHSECFTLEKGVDY